MIVGQAHRAQEREPTRSAWGFVRNGSSRAAQARFALPARSLQPLERPVLVSSIGVDLGDLIGRRLGEPSINRASAASASGIRF